MRGDDLAKRIIELEDRYVNLGSEIMLAALEDLARVLTGKPPTNTVAYVDRLEREGPELVLDIPLDYVDPTL